MEKEKQNKKTIKFYVSNCKNLYLELPESIAYKFATFLEGDLEGDEREVLREKLFEFYFSMSQTRYGVRRRDMEEYNGHLKGGK